MFYSKACLIFRATLICFFGLFPNYVLAKTTQNPIDQAIKRMSLEQKVGQLFMVGFPQTEMDEKLKKFIYKTKPGAFLLFKRNIKSLEQVAALNQQVTDVTHKASGLRPLIAVDQEGGVVSRVPVQPPLPSALALGLTDSTQLAETYGREVGSLLRRLGFNMNLAPVLDLSDPQQPSFIGVRSLGGNPEKVGGLGYSLSKGFSASKVIPTAKHFPGLGSSLHDPHNTLVTRITSLEDFYATDLKPFEKFSSLGASSAIMLSHLSYPILDSNNVPAVFSEKIVKSLLREKLGFKGIVLTDDLMMQGASQFAKPEEAAILALKAGADMIMVTWSFKAQEKAMLRVRQAILKKELSIEEVDQKIRRILLAKISVRQQPNRNLASPSPDNLKKIEQEILNSNIQSQAQKFESLHNEKNICVISTHKGFLASFKSGNTLNSRYLLLPLSSSSADLESLVSKNACKSVVFSVYGKKTAGIVQDLSLETKANFLLINLSAPMLTMDDTSYRAVVNLYFAHYNAGQKIAQYISKKKPNYQARTTSK